MQKRFAEYLIFGGPNGVVNKTEAAELAGYSVKRARIEGSELTNPRQSPLVVKYLDELKIEKMLKYGVTYESHVTELARIKDLALKKNAWSAAVQAEKNRGQAAGFYNHAQNIHVVNSIDSMSLDQVQSRLKDIRKLYGDIIDADFTEVKEIEQKKEG